MNSEKTLNNFISNKKQTTNDEINEDTEMENNNIFIALYILAVVHSSETSYITV